MHIKYHEDREPNGAHSEKVYRRGGPGGGAWGKSAWWLLVSPGEESLEGSALGLEVIGWTAITADGIPAENMWEAWTYCLVLKF